MVLGRRDDNVILRFDVRRKRRVGEKLQNSIEMWNSIHDLSALETSATRRIIGEVHFVQALVTDYVSFRATQPETRLTEHKPTPHLQRNLTCTGRVPERSEMCSRSDIPSAPQPLPSVYSVISVEFYEIDSPSCLVCCARALHRW